MQLHHLCSTLLHWHAWKQESWLTARTGNGRCVWIFSETHPRLTALPLRLGSNRNSRISWHDTVLKAWRINCTHTHSQILHTHTRTHTHNHTQMHFPSAVFNPLMSKKGQCMWNHTTKFSSVMSRFSWWSWYWNNKENVKDLQFLWW